MTISGTCNAGSGDPCRAFGYRIHQSSVDCPILPQPDDPQFGHMTDGQQETARAYWSTRRDLVQQAYADGFTAGVAFDVLPSERRVRAYAAEYARPTNRP